MCVPVRHLLEEGIVPATALRATFDDVARHHCAGNGVEVAVGPAERVQRRPDHQGGIGHPTRHDHLGAGRQRVGDRAGPQVGVRRHDGRVGGKDLAGVEVHELLPLRPQLVQARGDVVP